MGSLVYVFSERCAGKRPSRFRAIGAAIAGVVLAAERESQPRIDLSSVTAAALTPLLTTAPRRRQQASKYASDEADRCRQAAEVALQQLDWTINYLQRIRKPDIARALAKNHAHIRRQLIDHP